MKNHLCFKAYSGAFWGKAVVLAFCITLLAGCGSDVPEDCVIFHSEQEMIDTIQGSWFNYLKIGFDISGTTATEYIFYRNNPGYDWEIECDYKHSSFTEHDSRYYVKNIDGEIVIVSSGQKEEYIYKKKSLSTLPLDPNSTEYNSELNDVREVAKEYMVALIDEQNDDMDSIQLIGSGRASDASSYTFPCEVHFKSGLIRSGEIYVYKTSDGNLEVRQLLFDN